MKIKASGIHVFLLMISPLLIINCKCADLTYKQPDIPNGGRAVAVAMSPSSDDDIIVASETGGLFRTFSQGSSWRQVSKDATFRFRDVMYLPTDSDIVLAAANVDSRVISGGGIYRSSDKGQTWDKISIPGLTVSCTTSMAAHCLSHDATNNRLWAGTDCGLFYSDDLGITWNFLSGTTGLGSGSIRAILNPSEDRMVVLTGNRVRVSTDGGVNWTSSSTGLPPNVRAGQHNQIAVSAKNDDHIYFAFNFSEDGDAKNGLYYSQDFGLNWSVIVRQNGWNRPPFVVLSDNALLGSNNRLDMYYSNGGCQFRRREVIHGSIHGFGPWNNISIDHCDMADLGFGMDGKTPILLAGDGGLHKSADNGASWTMSGAGGDGYAALQITEVTGQLGSDIHSTDLYFGTQDNDNWASSDYGATWPNKRCCEGFYLNVPRASISAAQTTHTGVSCAGCGNYRSGPVLTSQAAWNNPPRSNGNPALIRPTNYVQKQFNLDSTAWRLARTTNTGGSWTSVVNLSENAMNLPLVVGSASNPIIYLATRKPGSTNGAPNIGLKRISGFLGSTVVQSELTGFGNIGTFPTMFAWYEVFGVKPSNPNFIIVPDIVNDVVKKSIDGGITWIDDLALTDAVTHSGEYKFHWDRFSQISSFGFDPECTDHIMVGTQHAGIFQSFDNGNSWELVKGSKNIPYVSSFFFPREGDVVISSYGRGLWQFKYKCPDPPVLLPPYKVPEDPILWFREYNTPLDRVEVQEDCYRCGFYILKDGEIKDVIYDEESGSVEQIIIDKGEFTGYDHKQDTISIPVKVSIGSGGTGLLAKNKNLAELLKEDLKVRGIYLKNSLFNGLLLSTNNISATQLPKIREKYPMLRLNLDADLGIPMNKVKELEITGYGWDSNYPVSILIDGIEYEDKEKVFFDEKGLLHFKIPPIFDIGNHEIRIRQQLENKVIDELLDIRITVADEPRDKN